jgi:4-hydroxy-tetrahydrodipicolinate reductase
MAADGVRIGIVGAAGRMGAALIREIAARDGARLSGAAERTGADAIGRDAGTLAGLEPMGLKVGDDAAALFAVSDVVIDFTAPAATARHAGLAAEARVPLVIGTTGLEAEHERAIAEAAARVAIVQSGNMSLGVNLLVGLTRRVADVLGPDFDVEIVEMHHRHKVDAPSGTALMLGRAAAEGRGVALDAVAARGRDGITGARRRGDIGFASLRGGDVVGEHSVIFAADGERVELVHKATDRRLFARGAVTAALWTRGRAPGLYSMFDVLGLS